MWRRFAHPEGWPPFFGRGAVKFIVLDLLKDKPKHGYEIMKDLEAKAGGFYAASPGTVYPTLQMLEDQGYVTSRSEDGKKVYEITAAGRAYLEDNRTTVDAASNHWWGPRGPRFTEEGKDIFRELHELVGLLVRAGAPGREPPPEKMKQVRDALARARREVEEALRR